MKAAIIALSRADIGDYTYYINQVVDNARQLGALNGFGATQDEFLADVLSACGVPVCEINAHDRSTVTSRD